MCAAGAQAYLSRVCPGPPRLPSVPVWREGAGVRGGLHIWTAQCHVFTLTRILQAAMCCNASAPCSASASQRSSPSLAQPASPSTSSPWGAAWCPCVLVLLVWGRAHPHPHELLAESNWFHEWLHIGLSVCVHLSVCMSRSPCLSACMSRSVCLFPCFPVSLSVCLSACLSPCYVLIPFVLVYKGIPFMMTNTRICVLIPFVFVYKGIPFIMTNTWIYVLIPFVFVYKGIPFIMTNSVWVDLHRGHEGFETTFPEGLGKAITLETTFGPGDNFFITFWPQESPKSYKKVI
jgi:hypothetical protein